MLLNYAVRVKYYCKVLKEKNVNIKVLNDFYCNINKILSNMNKNVLCYNDLWIFNFVL